MNTTKLVNSLIESCLFLGAFLIITILWAIFPQHKNWLVVPLVLMGLVCIVSWARTRRLLRAFYEFQAEKEQR